MSETTREITPMEHALGWALDEAARIIVAAGMNPGCDNEALSEAIARHAAQQPKQEPDFVLGLIGYRRAAEGRWEWTMNGRRWLNVFEHDEPLLDEIARLRAGVIQDDIAAILRALGLPDHARPLSAHAIVHDEILPAIAALRVRA